MVMTAQARLGKELFWLVREKLTSYFGTKIARKSYFHSDIEDFFADEIWPAI